MFTRGELVDACPMDADALERTVDSHVSRLRRKLRCAGASAMPEIMRGVGYRLHGARPSPHRLREIHDAHDTIVNGNESRLKVPRT
ncbi:winged helix-turn-helix domain-containing protein [Burkholderia multivorans]|nr:winged helix-turn-helix domain-containing protein [Burkholderia multivorans]